ncbi:MAG: pyridoxamine kinase [Lentisphaerae bacterium]|nr:pyridoxamine kinase [Lentisphaerota bacterium]
MKRVLSIQDISCVGKCSLTVALPIISAAGIETAILPTAVLSTHTVFNGFTFRDLTDDIPGIAEHWLEEKIKFDGISTGYLGSFRQIELVEKIFDDFSHPGMLRFVDPAMGDNGKLYPGFDEAFARKMGELCGKADIIVPNFTEAAFMLGEEYMADKDYSADDVKALLKRLCGLGSPIAAITGVSLEKGKYGVMAYDSTKDEYCEYYSEHLPYSFHGTGDVFSSACFAALMYGKPLAEALKVAVEFTIEAIRQTVAQENPIWYGVDFELAIPKLLELLK